MVVLIKIDWNTSSISKRHCFSFQNASKYFASSNHIFQAVFVQSKVESPPTQSPILPFPCAGCAAERC